MGSKFSCAAWRKGLGSTSILCQFFRCWLHKKCSGITGKLKEDSKFKCQTCESQEENIIENCPGMELKDHSLEIVERFYLSGTIGAGGMQLTVL